MSANDVIRGVNPSTGEIISVPVKVLSDGSFQFPNQPEAKLATVDLVDLNNDATPTLYTVPNEMNCIITKIVMRKASTSLSTASISIGWTTSAFNDVVANATHTALDGATKAAVLSPIAGTLVGTPGSTLKLKNNTKQGAPATASFDIFGILF
jgi:hypothetical protein